MELYCEMSLRGGLSLFLIVALGIKRTKYFLFWRDIFLNFVEISLLKTFGKLFT